MSKEQEHEEMLRHISAKKCIRFDTDALEIMKAAEGSP